MPVHVAGLREMTRAMERAGVEVDDLKNVMGAIATEARDVMTPNLPRRSGTLQNTARPNRAKGRAIVTVGTARVRYAAPLIYGWPKRHIRPSNAIERTDAVMETRAPELLAEGWNRIAEKNGLA